MEEDKSKFNMGIAMLRRVDALLSDCAEAKRDRAFPSWFDNLIALSGEISFTFKGDIKDKDNTFQDIISPYIDEFNEKMVLHNDKYTIRGTKEFSNYGFLFTLLTEYEKFIREELAKRDMLIAAKDDVRRAVTNY